MVKVVKCSVSYFLACRDSAQVDLKHKLKCLQGEHKSVGAALEIQCRENIKVSIIIIIKLLWGMSHWEITLPAAISHISFIGKGAV